MSKSSRATFLLDMARTPPRLAAKNDFPSPEMDEDTVIIFLFPPDVKKSRFVRSDRIASLVIDLGFSRTRMPDDLGLRVAGIIPSTGRSRMLSISFTLVTLLSSRYAKPM